MHSFPHYSQPDAKDCGPTCLRMISKHYGKNITLSQLRNLTETTREGSTLLGVSEGLKKLAFDLWGLKLQSINYSKLPCPVSYIGMAITMWSCMTSNQPAPVVFQIKKKPFFIFPIRHTVYLLTHNQNS